MNQQEINATIEALATMGDGEVIGVLLEAQEQRNVEMVRLAEQELRCRSDLEKRT